MAEFQNWFVVSEHAPGVFGIWEPGHAERVRSTLVVGDRSAVLIDTGMGVGDIAAVVGMLTKKPVQVINSHAHWDHIGGNWQFDEISVHEAEAGHLEKGVDNEQLAPWFAPEHMERSLPEGTTSATISIKPSQATRLLRGGEAFDLGGVLLEVIHAPGHSPGGIVLLDRQRGILFSTDVAYPSTLYCYGEGASLVDYCRTMSMLAELAASLTIVIPSHDDAPMDPGYLPRMSRGLQAIADGRRPDVVLPGRARHEFLEDGFAVLVRAEE